MRRKSFAGMPCPIARSLERVGEWWSILILRDAFAGHHAVRRIPAEPRHRADMLTRRLAALVESGLLERRRYSERPPRDEYVLTARGRGFRAGADRLLAWGNRHFAPEGATLPDRRQQDRQAGRPGAGRPCQRPAARRRPTHARCRAGGDGEHAAAGWRAAAGCSRCGRRRHAA